MIFLNKKLAMIRRKNFDQQGLSRFVSIAIMTGVLGASAILGRRNAPDGAHPSIRRWYQRLDKPAYTPPDAAFAMVWPGLEITLGLGGYRLLRKPSGERRNLALALWFVNVGLVGGWTQLFFRKRDLGASAAVSGLMLATGASYVAVAREVDRPTAATALPFVAWVGFATLLAGHVWQRNR